MFEKVHKELNYNPYLPDYREKRETDPHIFRHQGFRNGRHDNALDCLILYKDGTPTNIISFGNFEEKLDSTSEEDVRTDLGVARDIFFDFHPDTRPVLWRMLITQLIIHRCILETSYDRVYNIDEITTIFYNIGAGYAKQHPWISDDPIDDPIKVAEAYFEERIRRPLAKIMTMARDDATY